MKEEIAMVEAANINQKITRFENTLLSSIQHFRKGDDQTGFYYFLTSIDDLEILLKHYENMGKPHIEMDSMMTAYKNVHMAIQNQDIIGMTDVLEFEIYPLLEKWVKGSEEE